MLISTTPKPADLLDVPQPTEVATLALDPRAMQVGPDGLTSFHWPVTVAELLRVRDHFLEGFYAWLREEGVDRSRDAEVLWLNGAQIAVEVMRLFNGYAVSHRIAGYCRFAPSAHGAGLTQAIAAGEAPPDSVMTRRTLMGLPPDPLWRKPLRAVKYAFSGAIPTYRPKRLIDPRADTVTFSGGGLIARHADAVETRVVLSKFDEWMTPGRPHGVEAFRLQPRSREAICALVRSVFETAGERLPDVLEAGLRDYLARISARTAFHLEELERQAKQLPRILWCGSCGILYNRLMARAVAKAGGRAVGHDHGTGTGWWQTYYQTVTELNFLDRFVTYSEALAEGLRRHTRRDLTIDPQRICHIDALPARKASETAPVDGRRCPSTGGTAKPIKSVMYVPTAYTGDNMYLLPLLADAVAVDWQARLLAFLKAEGYEILIKPHPESPYPLPAAFANLFGAEILDAPFEAVLHRADCVLFDYLQTTCIVEAVGSDRAMVMIEFPRLQLDPEARILLERRAALVPGHFDADGRAQVAWPALRSGLAAAPDLRDRAFTESYFPR